MAFHPKAQNIRAKNIKDLEKLKKDIQDLSKKLGKKKDADVLEIIKLSDQIAGRWAAYDNKLQQITKGVDSVVLAKTIEDDVSAAEFTGPTLTLTHLQESSQTLKRQSKRQIKETQEQIEQLKGAIDILYRGTQVSPGCKKRVHALSRQANVLSMKAQVLQERLEGSDPSYKLRTKASMIFSRNSDTLLIYQQIKDDLEGVKGAFTVEATKEMSECLKYEKLTERALSKVVTKESKKIVSEIANGLEHFFISAENCVKKKWTDENLKEFLISYIKNEATFPTSIKDFLIEMVDSQEFIRQIKSNESRDMVEDVMNILIYMKFFSEQQSNSGVTKPANDAVQQFFFYLLGKGTISANAYDLIAMITKKESTNLNAAANELPREAIMSEGEIRSWVERIPHADRIRIALSHFFGTSKFTKGMSQDSEAASSYEFLFELAKKQSSPALTYIDTLSLIRILQKLDTSKSLELPKQELERSKLTREDLDPFKDKLSEVDLKMLESKNRFSIEHELFLWTKEHPHEDMRPPEWVQGIVIKYAGETWAAAAQYSALEPIRKKLQAALSGELVTGSDFLYIMQLSMKIKEGFKAVPSMDANL